MGVTNGPESSQIDFTLNAKTILIKNFDFEVALPCRIERKLRRQVFRQRDPDCSIVKRFHGFPEPQNGLGRMILETPNSSRTLYFRSNTSDKAVIGQIFRSRDYDLARFRRWSELRDFLANQHRSGGRPLIVDAGANIGASTAFFAIAFPTALVVAIEPEESNFDLLTKNSLGLNVEVMKAALSSETGRATVYNPGTEHWSFRTERTKSAEGVPCVTVDSLYSEFARHGVFPFIVKIDIEGGEEDVFMRNTEWVKKTPVIMIELHDWKWSKKGTSRPFLQCMSALDRDFLYSGENIFSIDNNLIAK